MNTLPEALRLAEYLDGAQRYFNGLQLNNPPQIFASAAAELRRLHEVNQELMGALKMAILQNEHDMIMTGEECRKAHAALAKATGKNT